MSKKKAKADKPVDHAAIFAKIPEDVKKTFTDYGFPDTLRLEEAVAYRTGEDWCAILWKRDDSFIAVDFHHSLNFSTREWSWEVQNDEIGPFASIDEFLNEPLTKAFF